MRGPDGILRFPTQLIEIIFQISIGLLFILFVKRGILFGRLFSLYLMAYGTFRFVTEFIRDTPKFSGGYSGYQVLSLIMIGLGSAFFLKRTLAPPLNWSGFRAATVNRQQPAGNVEASHG